MAPSSRSLFWRKLTTAGALSGMVVGAAVVFIWGNSPLSATLYEIVPAFLASLVVAVVVSRLTWKPNPEIEAEFDSAVHGVSGRKEPVAVP